MNLFHSLKKQRRSFNITEPDNEYKVKYLGNVLTAFMRGEGCVDRPVQILWDNFVRNENTCLSMEMLVCASGLKVQTKEQGLTEYRFHRIAFCTHLPSHPRLFIWVYRHEGKKLKVELRCHAALLKSEEKAKDVQQQLQKKLNSALQEYTREKTRNQNSRLTLEKAKSMKLNNNHNSNIRLHNNIIRSNNNTNNKHGRSKSYSDGMDVKELIVPRTKPVRLMFLSQSDNYKPPSELSTKAPKLHSITEEIREEAEEEEEEEEDDDGDEEKEDMIGSETICLNPHILSGISDDKLPDTIPTGDNEKDNLSNESGFMDENDSERV